MKHLFYILVPALLLGASPMLHAAPSVAVSDAWIEIVNDDVISQPGYLVLENTSDKDVILVRARSSGFDLAMIHQSTVDRGETRMMLKQELLIPAGRKIVLSAKSVHLMFAGRKGRQKSGEKVKVTLVFSDGNQAPVEFEYRQPSRRQK